MFLEIGIYVCKKNAKANKWVYCLGSNDAMQYVINYKKRNNVCHHREEEGKRNEEVEQTFDSF